MEVKHRIQFGNTADEKVINSNYHIQNHYYIRNLPNHTRHKKRTWLHDSIFWGNKYKKRHSATGDNYVELYLLISILYYNFATNTGIGMFTTKNIVYSLFWKWWKNSKCILKIFKMQPARRGRTTLRDIERDM